MFLFLLAASLLASIAVEASDNLAGADPSSESSASSASGGSHQELSEPTDANAGLFTFKSWELLDPSSERALERAKRHPFQTHLQEYVIFFESGKAKELMPDPFFHRHEQLERPKGGLQGLLSWRSSSAEGADAPPSAMASCRFEEGHDYPGVDIMTIPGSSQQQCCRACLRFNERSPGSCVVAVLSSEHDDPPLSCWVKSQIQASVSKEGVVACIPDEKK